MKRSSRPSTAENSKKLEAKLEQRKLKSQERRARSLLRKRVDVNEASVEESFEQPPPEEVVGAQVDTEIGVLTSEEEEYWKDTTAEELSLVVDPVTPLSVAGFSPDRWSSVNRFYPEDSVRSSVASTEVIESILQSIVEEEEVISTREMAMARMDVNEFNTKFNSMKKHANHTKTLINRFNEKTVTFVDVETFAGNLQIIYDKFMEVANIAEDIKAELDVNLDNVALDQVKTLFEETEKSVLSNESKVKAKILELKRSPDPEKCKRDSEVVSLKMNNALNDFSKLRDEISKVPAVKELSEAKISEYVRASKEWKKDLKLLKSLKETIDIEVIKTEVDADLHTRYKDVFEKMLEKANAKIEELSKADDELGLHSMVDVNKGKRVEYPKKFSGGKGEDVFKFIKEFQDALNADHVRKADEVKVLMKLLDGRAKSCVGEHQKEVKLALDQLKNTFGVPKFILAEYFKVYEEKYGTPKKWGKHGSQQRLDAVDGTLDFIRQLKSLAEDHPESLKSTIYGKDTLETLAKGIPFEYQKDVSKLCTHTDSHEKWIETIYSTLETVRNSNVSSLTTGFGMAKSVNDGDTSTKNKSANSCMVFDGHDCRKDNHCKPKWDYLGCVHLYKLTMVEERKTFLFKRKACFSCGKFPYKRDQKHKCSWNNGKFLARCTYKDASGVQCARAAAMCKVHPDNITDGLKDWLLSINIKFSVNMIIMNSIEENLLSQSYYEDKIKKLSIPEKCVSKVKNRSNDRQALQDGNAFHPMNDDEIHEFFSADMRKIDPSAVVNKIPDGEPVFIFCVVQGLCNPVMTFIDSGANCWLARTGIPEKEFISTKIGEGPIPLNVASGITTFANAEWASLLPLSNGNYQAVRGLTLQKVTADMPELNLTPAFEKIKSEHSGDKRISNLTVPSVVGGNIQMIIGIKYANLFPEVIHTFPSGLTVFKSKLRPAGDSGALACIGGPVSSLEHLCSTAGSLSTLSYMANLIHCTGQHLKIDLFPENSYCSKEEKYFVHTSTEANTIRASPGTINTTFPLEIEANTIRASPGTINTTCSLEIKANTIRASPGTLNTTGSSEIVDNATGASDDEISPCICCGTLHLEKELEKFMKMQDTGLDTNYKCPKCRGCKSCLKGSGQELLNMKEEYQQQIIEDSVRIDDDLGQAVGRLAFVSDPSENIINNENIAVRRLKNVCKKYANNSAVKEMISKGFKKLVDRGHILMYEDLSVPEQEMFEEETSYFIPWDVSFKEDSFSTPARPVFDASSKTAAGGSLNDNLAKGKTNLVDLFGMVMGWKIGPIAIHGDISQFYNCVKLDNRDWKFQKVVWYDDLNMDNPMKKGVVCTFIYGVVCVCAQTEHVKFLLGNRVIEKATTAIDLKVGEFIAKGFYVDDGGTSVPNMEIADSIISTTDTALSSINMKVKGWSVSFRQPSPEVTDDNVVGFAGMNWIPAIDSYSLKIQRLHFGKKKRGRFPESLEIYEGGAFADFVPTTLSRRMCTSVTARIYDVTGILAPLTLKLKFDLRKILRVDPDWDKPVGEDLRRRWIENFEFIEEMRDILYVRCMIPEDAKRCTVALWLLCDASPDGGILIVAYALYERKDGSWSCQLLCAKNVLIPEGWTTPQAELHALSSLASMAYILWITLSSWIEIMRYGSDSSIAISWVVYEKVRLHIFHRMRVANIRSKINLEELYHVVGKQNVADTGTRPDLLKPEHLLPGSEWMCGKEWMKMPVEKAVECEAIKNIKDIKLDNDAKKMFKEGVLLDSTLNNIADDDLLSVNSAFTKQEKLSISTKVIEREKFSNYLLSPLKWSFPKFVRIMGFVHLAVMKWKHKLALRRLKRGLGLSDGSTPESIVKVEPAKFSVFAIFGEKVTSFEFSLSEIFCINGVNVALDSTHVHVRLSDHILSKSLEHIYKKTSAEVLHFNDRKFVDKIGTVSDGILYCKKRIEESQTLKIVGGLEDIMDLKSFTGCNFKVPVIDKYSPMAISLASHLHYNVVKHHGAETVYRMSLQYAHILGGRSLLQMMRDECIFCQKMLRKYTKQLMGPLSDEQLSISPVFYYTYADAWGPLRAYVPGFEKSTRAGSKVYEVYILVFGCAATGTVNCQVMEAGKKTCNVLDAMNRFFHEESVPKIFHIDKDGALIKALSEAEIDVRSLDGFITKEKGIAFKTCSAQGHSAHGRIERKIKMLQEAFERSEFKKFKLHGLGWQTVAKCVEHQVNSIPLGYLNHREDNASLLRILTPNFLKLNAAANRSPSSLFSLPKSGKDLFSKVEDAYRVFYKIFNDVYVPLIAKRQKWHEEHENLKENDVVYFKLTDSVLGSNWLIGKVEDVKLSKDGKVRLIIVGYKYDTEDGRRDFRLVERPVRQCVKLWNIEDTTILEDIARVRQASADILGEDFSTTTTSTQSSVQPPIVPLVYTACNAIMGDEVSNHVPVNLGIICHHKFESTYEELFSKDEVGKEERKLGLYDEETSEFFDIPYDLNDNFSHFVLV